MKLIFVFLLALFGLNAFGASHPLGLVVPKDWDHAAKFSTALLGVNLPAEFDLRVENKFLSPVKNQSSCGSCWAFATTAALESLVEKTEQKTVDLAEQELVSCDKTAYGCGGGFFTALDYQVKTGQTFEPSFPYRAANLRCKQGLSHETKSVEWGYIGDQGRQPTPEEIKAYVFSGLAVPVVVSADNRFMNYRGGVYGENGCSHGGQLNHMVNIVGWSDKGGYWIMRNSWGESWGEKGYMRIKVGCNRIGEIAGFAVFKP